MKAQEIKGELKKRAAKAAGKAESLYEAGKEKMSHVEFRPLWDRIKVGFGKTAAMIGRGTEKAAGSVALTAKRAGIQYEIHDLHRKLHKLTAELGATVYDSRRRGARSISFTAPPVKDLIRKIGDLEKQVDAMEKRARTLKKAA